MNEKPIRIFQADDLLTRAKKMVKALGFTGAAGNYVLTAHKVLQEYERLDAAKAKTSIIDSEVKIKLTQDQNCVNCIYFFGAGYYDGTVCRRHAPLFVEVCKRGTGRKQFSRHPDTSEELWCGDWAQVASICGEHDGQEIE
jgi:hypothetical protein